MKTSKKIQSRFNLARGILTAIGGKAALVAGYGEHYHADHQTPKRTRTRGRVGGGTYGASLRAHFDSKGIVWSAKKNAQPVKPAPVKQRMRRDGVKDGRFVFDDFTPSGGRVYYRDNAFD